MKYRAALTVKLEPGDRIEVVNGVLSVAGPYRESASAVVKSFQAITDAEHELSSFIGRHVEVEVKDYNE